MRLLGQVLGEQLAGGVDRLVVVMVHRANHQLRPVDIIQRAPGFLGADLAAVPWHDRCTPGAHSS